MMLSAVLYFALLSTSPLEVSKKPDEIIMTDFDQTLQNADEVIVISDVSDPNSRVLTLQDFNMNGEMVIPFFLDQTEFDSQTKGSGFEKKGLSVKTEFLASILQGSEIFVLNPGGPNPKRFTSNELIKMWGSEN